MKFVTVFLFLISFSTAGDRNQFTLGFSGSSTGVFYKWQNKFEPIGFDLGIGWVQGTTANLYPMLVEGNLPLNTSNELNVSAIIGLGASWVVPRDAIGAETLLIPTANFGVAFQYRWNENFGYALEFKQFANWVDNEWIERKEWIFYQSIHGGIWFEL